MEVLEARGELEIKGGAQCLGRHVGLPHLPLCCYGSELRQQSLVQALWTRRASSFQEGSIPLQSPNCPALPGPSSSTHEQQH